MHHQRGSLRLPNQETWIVLSINSPPSLLSIHQSMLLARRNLILPNRTLLSSIRALFSARETMLKSAHMSLSDILWDLLWVPWEILIIWISILWKIWNRLLANQTLRRSHMKISKAEIINISQQQLRKDCRERLVQKKKNHLLNYLLKFKSEWNHPSRFRKE